MAQQFCCRRLRGAVNARIVVGRNRVILTRDFLKAKGQKYRIGGETLEVLRAEKDRAGGYELQIAVQSPKRCVPQHWWLQRVHLEDAAGNRYTSNSSGQDSWSNGAGIEYTVALGYPKANDPKVGPATTLVVEDWVIVNHRIDFEFRNVPLP